MMAACSHRHSTKAALVGGEGPDYAGWTEICSDCGAHRWQYCDKTYSTWRSGPSTWKVGSQTYHVGSPYRVAPAAEEKFSCRCGWLCRLLRWLGLEEA